MTSSLAGKRVVVTSAGDVAERLAARLQSKDAEVIACPTISFGQDEETRSNARWAAMQLVEGIHEWVLFTSGNAIDPFLEELGDRIFAAFRDVKVGAVGPTTAEKLRSCGIEVDVLPERFTAADLADALGDPEGGKRILIPRAAGAPQQAVDALRERGWEVHDAAVYRTIPVAPRQEIVERVRAWDFDAVAFASGSAARSFTDNVASADDLGLAPAGPAAQIVAAIGPQTAQVLRDMGFEVDAVADEQTVDGLIAALESRFAGG